MNVPLEIEKHAAEADKLVLRELFKHYHWASQWKFVAQCTWKRMGEHPMDSVRVWHPTDAGRRLYASFKANPG